MPWKHVVLVHGILLRVVGVALFAPIPMKEIRCHNTLAKPVLARAITVTTFERKDARFWVYFLAIDALLRWKNRPAWDAQYATRRRDSLFRTIKVGSMSPTTMNTLLTVFQTVQALSFPSLVVVRDL